MSRWIDKVAGKIGRLAITNLMKYIVVSTAAVFALDMVFDGLLKQLSDIRQGGNLPGGGLAPCYVYLSAGKLQPDLDHIHAVFLLDDRRGARTRVGRGQFYLTM